jgi:hypothetical protein
MYRFFYPLQEISNLLKKEWKQIIWSNHGLPHNSTGRYTIYPNIIYILRW